MMLSPNHLLLFQKMPKLYLVSQNIITESFWSNLSTAWVGSLGYGFLFVIGPITTALCEHFGCRVMACAGSVLTTFSLLVTSFASSISTMYFTFGVLWGTGGSFLFFSGLLVLRFYFNRNVSLANGITMTGAGFGTLIFNVMLQELDEKYGWRGGMRVLSVFSALTFLCGCAYIPPPVEYLPFERRSLSFRLKGLIDPRPWRDRAFPMWLVSLSFILFAYFFPYTYLVSTVHQLHRTVNFSETGKENYQLPQLIVANLHWLPKRSSECIVTSIFSCFYRRSGWLCHMVSLSPKGLFC